MSQKLKPLTNKQREIFLKIRELSKKREPVTLEEIKKHLGYNSKGVTAVKSHTDALKEKGYLENTTKISLKPSSTEVQIPLVGCASCGQPMLAEENIEAYIAHSSSLLKGKDSDYFFLRARGNSMNKTNINGKTINEGDFVLANKTKQAKFGDRIIALIGEEATIKLYKKGDGCIVLQPESNDDSNKPIYLFDDFTIQGVVEDVVKKGN